MEEIEKLKILIVDDGDETLIALDSILEDQGLDIIKATLGDDALLQLLKHDIAIILLNVQRQEMDGFETAELIRSNFKAKHTPIIFLTSFIKEQKLIFKGYTAGPVDYLTKPVNANMLRSKIAIFTELYRQRNIIENQNKELAEANKKIIEQQEALIEEERIKTLLQFAGAKTHELNQPLTILLNNIEMLQKTNCSPEELTTHISTIEEAGKNIANIVKRIQLFRNDRVLTPSNDDDADTYKIQNILWVEDDNICFKIFNKMLTRKMTTSVTRAINIREAKTYLSENNYDLAILDFRLPDGNSLELLSFIKERGIKLAALVLTGDGDEVIAAQCIQTGAHGYLPKSKVCEDELHKSIESAFEKYRLDSEMKKAIAKMAEMSMKDELTGLYNRRYMNECLDREFSRAFRYGSDLSCLILDIDFFKQVNDTYGHDCGDFVLKILSNLLVEHTRDSDYTFRYGGEEFMILLPQTDMDGAAQAAEKIREICESTKYEFNDHTVHVTVSIGISSVHNCLPEQPKDLIAFADKALYRAKAEGRNCVKVYQKEKEIRSPYASEQMYGQRGVKYFKDQIASILEKTRTATMASIELLIKDMEEDRDELQNQRIIKYIHLICNKLHLPGSITKAIVQAASLHGCFNTLLGEELIQKKDL